MKYFTDEMWDGINNRFGSDDEIKYNNVWTENMIKYNKIFESISYRLDKRTYTYFKLKGFHDFKITNIEILHNECGKKPIVKINLYVTNKINKYKISFTKIINFEIKTSENINTHWGLDDWGYEEILPVDDKILSFEVLLASGSTIYIQFPNKSLKILKIKN